jgi:hypothetical protein
MPKNWLVMEGDGPPAPFRARLRSAAEELPPGAGVLLIAAGAGVTAGAALYHTAPHPV